MDGVTPWTASASSLLLATAPPAQSDEGLSGAVLSRLPHDWGWLTDPLLAGNAAWRMIGLFITLLIVLIAGRLLRAFLNAAATRFESRSSYMTAVMLQSLARSTGFVSLILGLKCGMAFLVLNDAVYEAVSKAGTILMTASVGYIAYCLVSVVDAWLRRISDRTPSKLDDMLVPLVRKSLRGTIVILVLVQVATILSKEPVTSIIAGLGVGGLAIGLAAQDTVKNFFGSVMIFSDRPFELGDEITVDSLTGKVEVVGFRSTRFRTADGHLVTIPNGELANKTIVNISRRANLARRFNVALAQDSSPDEVARAVAAIKDLLADHEGMQAAFPPRVSFSELSPGGLVISIAYWYHPADSSRFAAFNERMNFEILRRLAEVDVPLALPLQSARSAGSGRDDRRVAA